MTPWRSPVTRALSVALCVAAVHLSDWTPLSAAPRKATIIYSHGTTRPQQVENCDAPANRVPPSLKQLESRGLATIRYLCSKATDDGVRGSYIYKRAAEIGAVVDELLAKNVSPKDIFLAGHSAGAWSSLMYMRGHAAKVNAAILFAPACCGPRYEIDQYPAWLKEVQPRQISEIVSGQPITSLVFAYTDDAFNRPEELSFLTKAFPSSTQLVVSSCGNGHLTLLRDCKEGQTADLIRKFVESRMPQ
jgi:pimeloyl-ACP methyl ester carboxylesterase